MTTRRSKKALFIGLPLTLALAVGGGLAAWDHWWRDNPGYPVKVMKEARELHERLLSFDSPVSYTHLTLPTKRIV